MSQVRFRGWEEAGGYPHLPIGAVNPFLDGKCINIAARFRRGAQLTTEPVYQFEQFQFPETRPQIGLKAGNLPAVKMKVNFCIRAAC